jgi:fructan beta-fructosidase
VRLAVLGERAFIIGYDAANEKLFIDRTGVGDTAFNRNYAALSRYETHLSTINHKIKLHIFFDNSIVEVFAHDGNTAMTAQLFPEENANGIELFSDGSATKFESVKLWKMKSSW